MTSRGKEIQQNIKLGTFVLVGVILFLIAVIFIGSENNVFTRRFMVYAIFKNIEGLKEGDNVWLSGVKVGTVRSIRIIEEGKVIVTLGLRDKQNQFIKKNATAFIGSDGFVGNKIVVIRPGTSAQTIQDSDTIKTSSPADTQELLNLAQDVGQNTRTLTFDLKELARKINEGQGIVGELLSDGDFARDLRAAADRMRTTTLQTSRASEELYTMLHKLNTGDGLVHRLSADTTLSNAFDETVTNMKQVSRNTLEVSQGLEQLVSKLNDSSNVMGVLLADTVFANQLRSTIENAETASGKLDENMDALRNNFLLRGYFKKKQREENRKQSEQAAGQKSSGGH